MADEVEGRVKRAPQQDQVSWAKQDEGRPHACCPQAGALSADAPGTVNLL